MGNILYHLFANSCQITASPFDQKEQLTDGAIIFDESFGDQQTGPVVSMVTERGHLWHDLSMSTVQ